MNEKKNACLAMMFDPQKKLDVRRFVAVVEEWLGLFGSKPGLVSIGAPGFSRKAVSFSRVRKKLVQASFEEAKFVELLTVPPDCQDMKESLYDVGLSQSRRDVHISVATSERTMSNEAWLDVAQRMLAVGFLQYGYAYVLPVAVGPAYYAAGVAFSTDPGHYHEEKLRGRWYHVLDDPIQFPPSRTLRQVYHFQIVSEGHLTLGVASETLQQWIRDCPSRGELKPFAPGLWAWSIADVEQVYAANLALFKAGLLAAWDPELANPL